MGWSCCKTSGLPGFRRAAFCLGTMNFLAEFAGTWYTVPAALLQTGNRKEVSVLEYIINFILTVIGNIVADCVNKWLDRKRRGK